MASCLSQWSRYTGVFKYRIPGAVLLILLPLPHFFGFQDRTQGRITFDTMDFVAEEVCIALTLLLGIFFLHHALEEALGWALDSGVRSSVQVPLPTQCVTLS